ncbi:MAG TPA: hypothetical protein VGS41_10880, partial [Chthonomonadales bacterium]|nr:hypothetical protein [Chthonomonadales bacterium]
MSRKQAPTLHIEWSSTCVAAVDIVTGQNSEAGSVAALGPILNGHKQALVGVSRSQVFLRTVRLPRAEPADLRRIVEVQLAHYFPLPPFELSFDCVQTADRTDEGFLTILAAIRTDDLKRLRADLKQVGISPTRTLPVALGAQAVAAHSGVEDAVVVSDSVTGLALDVVQGGALRFSRLVPTDSDPLTEAKRTLAGARIDDLPLLAVGELSLPGALPASGAALDRLHEAPEFDFELAEDRLRVARQQVGAATRRAVLLLAAAALLAVYVWSDRTASMAALESGQASWNRKQATLRSEERAESDTVQT